MSAGIKVLTVCVSGLIVFNQAAAAAAVVPGQVVCKQKAAFDLLGVLPVNYQQLIQNNVLKCVVCGRSVQVPGGLQAVPHQARAVEPHRDPAPAPAHHLLGSQPGNYFVEKRH